MVAPVASFDASPRLGARLEVLSNMAGIRGGNIG